MRIEVRGRNVEVSDELRSAVVARFKRVGKQVSTLAQLEVELQEERKPRISDRMVAEATLYLKGVTLRARETSPDMLRRQVKKHREKRRARERTRRTMARMRSRSA